MGNAPSPGDVLDPADIVDPILDALSPLISAVTTTLSPLINAVKNILKPLIQAITPALTAVINTALDIAVDVITDAIDVVNTGLGGLIDEVKGVLDDVWDAVQDIVEFAEDIWNEINQYLSEIYDFIINLPDLIIGFLVDVIRLVQALTSVGVNALNTALASLNGIVNRMTTVAVAGVEHIITKAFAIYNGSMRALKQIITLSLDSINIALDRIGAQANALLASFLREFRSFGERAVKRAASATKGLTSDLLRIKLALAGVSFGGTMLVFTGKSLVT